jgi:hypothetical protein
VDVNGDTLCSGYCATCLVIDLRFRGGMVPLGYESRERRLVVNGTEAD